MCAAPSRNPDLASRFPGLFTLAQNYLSDAWEDMYETPERAVSMFRMHHPELTRSAVDGIDALMREHPSERAREDALDELDWGYAPAAGELDAFLTWARDALQSQQRAVG